MKIKEIFIIIVLLIVSIAVGTGFYKITRKISYDIKYKDQVQSTIKEMVKPECLK